MMKTNKDLPLFTSLLNVFEVYIFEHQSSSSMFLGGHADVFDLFAKTGISLKQPSSKIGMTALHIAAYYGEEDICRELFKHIPAPTRSSLPTKPENALVEELCYEGDLTALHLASYSGSENVVRAILNQPGVDVKQPSAPSGYTGSAWNIRVG